MKIRATDHTWPLFSTLLFFKVRVLCRFSHVWLYETIRTVACQAPLSLGLSWQEYWSGLPFPPPGDLPNPRIEPTSLISPALAGRFFTTRATSFCFKSLQFIYNLEHISFNLTTELIGIIYNPGFIFFSVLISRLMAFEVRCEIWALLTVALCLVKEGM